MNTRFSKPNGLITTICVLIAATMVVAAEMRTWTFEKSGKTMQVELVS